MTANFCFDLKQKNSTYKIHLRAKNNLGDDRMEEENKKVNEAFEEGEFRLFPDEFSGSTASVTECTGLIQVAPVTDEVQEVYDSVYNYRQKKPKKYEKKK